MKIKVISAPVSANFEEGLPYHVYGFSLGERQSYVFDEDVEAFNLIDLKWELYEDAS